MLKNNLAIRVATAVVALPVLLWLLFSAPHWGWYLLVLAACCTGAAELFGMTHPRDRVAQSLGILTTASTSAVLYWQGHDARWLTGLLLVITMTGVLLPLWRLGDLHSAGLRLMAGVAGPLYVGALLTTLALLRRDAGPGFVLLALAFAWLGDTGGYFFGRFLGKRKLYPAVSPKKTVAGLVGAMVGAGLGGVVIGSTYLHTVPLHHSVLLAIIAGAAGQLGDLAESLLKRSTGIKDSGSIIPGHGGILDRIDALLLVAPIVYLYVLFWSPV